LTADTGSARRFSSVIKMSGGSDAHARALRARDSLASFDRANALAIRDLFEPEHS
jgi:hypothetical protein